MPHKAPSLHHSFIYLKILTCSSRSRPESSIERSCRLSSRLHTTKQKKSSLLPHLADTLPRLASTSPTTSLEPNLAVPLRRSMYAFASGSRDRQTCVRPATHSDVKDLSIAASTTPRRPLFPCSSFLQTYNVISPHNTMRAQYLQQCQPPWINVWAPFTAD